MKFFTESSVHDPSTSNIKSQQQQAIQTIIGNKIGNNPYIRANLADLYPFYSEMITTDISSSSGDFFLLEIFTPGTVPSDFTSLKKSYGLYFPLR